MTSVNMPTIGRTLDASLTFMSIRQRSSAISGLPKRRQKRIVMAATWSTVALTATAGKKRSTTRTTTRSASVTARMDAGRSTARTTTLSQRRGPRPPT